MSKSMQEIGGNAIIYSYPSGDYDIVCAGEKWFKPLGWEAVSEPSEPDRRSREAGVVSQGEDRLRSIRRARAKLRRLALANDFDYFVTLTLDGSKVDRYEPKEIGRKLNRWLDNMVRRHGLRYVLVPERHKDGAFHFHGFFAGDGLQAVDSGTISLPGSKPRKPKNEAERASWLANCGQVVYNLPQWDYGFSTAIKLYGTYSAAVGYVCKYIGKEDGERPMGRWYYSGGGLKEPPKLYTILDYNEVAHSHQGEVVEFSIPGSKILVVHHREAHNGQE